MKKIVKILALMATAIYLVGLLMGKITFCKFILVISIAWVGVPLMMFVFIPLIVAFIVLIWKI